MSNKKGISLSGSEDIEIYYDGQYYKIESDDCEDSNEEKEEFYDITERDVDDDKDYTLTGTTKFTTSPNPDIIDFCFDIIQDDGTIVNAKINRYDVNCFNLLNDGKKYKFAFKDNGYVDKYKSAEKFNEENYTSEYLLEVLDRNIFVCEAIDLENNNYEKKLAAIEIKLIGVPKNLRKEETKYEFIILDDDIRYKCIFDKKLAHASMPNKLNKGQEYIFDAVLVSDKVYIYTFFSDVQDCENSGAERKNIDKKFERGVFIYDIENLKKKFEIYKDSYPQVTRDAIVTLFERYRSNENVDINRKILRFLVNYIPDRNMKEFDLKEIKHIIDTSHYAMDDVKEAVISYIATRNINPYACARCLWLNGPYGVGKTSICKAIADAMGRKFIKISLNGVATSVYVKGTESSWNHSTAGIVMDELSKAGTDQVVILLDEIDKMSTGSHNGDPYTTLLDLLDDSGMFTDIFTEVPIDVSGVFFVASSNDAEKVPASLQDRMELIELAGYTEDEKKHIAKEYILPQKCKQYFLPNNVLSKELIDKLVTNYCKSSGVRDIDKAINKILREYVKCQQLGEKVKINNDFVTKVLGAKPLLRGNVTDDLATGLARGLAVSGNNGTTFAVQVTENQFGDQDEITGLPKQSTIDSVKIAKFLVSKKIGKKLPFIHIHFGEGGIEKDGPSAGITIFAAMYSCLMNKPIDNHIGMTGEIDILGDVWAVGGIETKIIAAENAGCNKVLIPKGNYEQLVESSSLSKYSCNIIPISNVWDVFVHLDL